MYSLLALSAFFYALPFWFSSYCWWLVFLFPLPFISALQRKKLNFFQGYFWGWLVFAFHLSGIFISLYAMGMGSWYIKIAPILGALFFLPLSTGILFLLISIITSSWCTPTRKIIRACVLLVICITYNERFILWPFDRCEGYFLMHPVVPLAAKPSLLWSMNTIGTFGTLILIIFLSAAGLTMYLRRTIMSGLASASILFYWVYTAFFLSIPTPFIPAWACSIARAPYVMSGDHTFKNIAAPIEYAIACILEKKPTTTCIIFPESSCHADDVYTYQELCSTFIHSTPGKSLDVLIGAFRTEGKAYYNTMYLVRNGKLEKHIDKCHAMILTERVPHILSWIPCFNYMYVDNEPPITPSCDERCPLLLSSGGLVVPYICSELFFNHAPHDLYTHLPVLLSANDVWVKSSYIKKLMLLAAQARAKQWNRPILFISYTGINYITSQGYVITIE